MELRNKEIIYPYISDCLVPNTLSRSMIETEFLAPAEKRSRIVIESESLTPAEEEVVQTTNVSSLKESRSFDKLKIVFEQPASDFDHLFENNRAWVDACIQSDPEFFEKMASGQAPKILFIGCADSRVSAQEILGLKPGEAFIHRNVANLVVNGDMNMLAVLQYAVEFLNVEDIIVCGHIGCGGIKAAKSEIDHGLLEHWLRNIRDVIFQNIEEIRSIEDQDEQFERIVELNVETQCLNIYRNPIVQRKQLKTGSYPRIHGFVYDIRNGLMKELAIDFGAQIAKNHEVYGVMCKSMMPLPALEKTDSSTAVDIPVAHIHSLQMTRKTTSNHVTRILESHHELEYLFENNRRWVQQQLQSDPDYFLRMVMLQTPRYLFIGCSDSRVPAQAILGLKQGEAFIHRNIANLVVNGDMNFLAVLQYAIEYLGVQDIIVCGHQGCGGCKAANSPTDHGLLEHWLRNIRDVIFANIEEIRSIKDAEAQHQKIVELNVREQCMNLCRNPIVQQRQMATGLYPRVHGFVYDIRNGLIKELDIDFHAEAAKNHPIYGVECAPRSEA